MADAALAEFVIGIVAAWLALLALGAAWTRITRIACGAWKVARLLSALGILPTPLTRPGVAAALTPKGSAAQTRLLVGIATLPWRIVRALHLLLGIWIVPFWRFAPSLPAIGRQVFELGLCTAQAA